MSEENKIDFVIGAGFGRTGTSSLQTALAKLNFQSYHMTETFKKENKNIHEDAIISAGILKCNLQEKMKITKFGDWHKMLVPAKDFDEFCDTLSIGTTYTATVDHPLCAWYQEFMRKFPNNSKVILTVRDSPQKWYKSIRSLFALWGPLSDRWFVKYIMGGIPSAKHWILVEWSVWKLLFGKYDMSNTWEFGGNDGGKYACDRYESWIESVKTYCKSVGREKDLLVFNVKEGWEPLCTFLNVKEIPNVPFPHSNSMDEMRERAGKISGLADTVNYVLIAIVIAAIAYFVFMYDGSDDDDQIFDEFRTLVH